MDSIFGQREKSNEIKALSCARLLYIQVEQEVPQRRRTPIFRHRDWRRKCVSTLSSNEMSLTEIASIMAVEREDGQFGLADALRTSVWYVLEIDPSIAGKRFADAAASRLASPRRTQSLQRGTSPAG